MLDVSGIIRKKFDFSHDDSEQLKFKSFQDCLTSNFNTFRTQFGFQEFSQAWKKNFFQELSETHGQHDKGCVLMNLHNLVITRPV